MEESRLPVKYLQDSRWLGFWTGGIVAFFEWLPPSNLSPHINSTYLVYKLWTKLNCFAFSSPPWCKVVKLYIPFAQDTIRASFPQPADARTADRERENCVESHTATRGCAAFSDLIAPKQSAGINSAWSSRFVKRWRRQTSRCTASASPSNDAFCITPV